MKKYLLFFAIAAGFTAKAQVSGNSAPMTKANDSIVFQKPDFTFYSKNYNTIFDYYQYTFDAQKISKRSVYVGANNKFYFGQNAGFVTDMPQPSFNSYRLDSGYAYDIVGLVRGINLIVNSGKDYSVKLKPKGVEFFTGNP
ncbi:hypothetical protein HYN59_15865 [Flavobacterium album]|uniref:Gliding motility protein RemB n=1 Tax=Flavobacterium album TaxID=2175091 RepID=A0A2S1R1H4_9FLAO|nr:hypothetical protein [Flavobacterium album]AWH86494.1 hypothetical protein HYN59_15865 [Flavobacterium album]